MWWSGFIFLVYTTLSNAKLFNYYTGLPTTPQQLALFKHLGNVDTCTIDIKPCNPEERSRVDGSCNSLTHPTKGTYMPPVIRLMPPHYCNVSDPRKAVSGRDLPLPRICRTSLLTEGKTISLEFTQAVPGFGVFMFADIGSVHDIYNFINITKNCCARQGEYACTPNIIPEDDPVHRFSGIRCMNLTRPMTFQSLGCTDAPVPVPIEQATSVFDLSLVYNFANKGDKVIRSYEGGQLSTVTEDGVIWPPNGPGYCPLNRPDETKCFGNYANLILSASLFSVWFMRHHNYIATELARVNPCWDDETLFQVARDINVAFTIHMFFYEWSVEMLGHDNMLKHGLISRYGGFRDVYNRSKYPIITLEYTYIMRWYHTTQDATAKMYESDGTFLKDYPMLNLTFRTGLLAKDNNFAHFSQNHFRQPCNDFDHTIDPDMAERGLPEIQLAVDIATSDLYKGRLIGLAPYIDYLRFCFGRKITTFDDLAEDMSQERIEMMKLLYEDVRDIDLMAGLWSENKIEGGKIPQTAACITIDQMKRSLISDRHWYERPNRPHAFTAAQLREIQTKSSLASLICRVGDAVYEIQRHAFRTISPRNPVVHCSEIEEIDFSAWADPACRCGK